MSISLVQQDGVKNYTANMSATNTFFGTANGLANVTTGNALVVIVSAQREDNIVTSITDNFGNEYRQVPNARVANTTSGANMCDIWWTQNIVGGQPLQLTVNLEGTENNPVYGWDVVVLECSGFANAPTPSVGTTVFNDTEIGQTHTGAALESDKNALFITVLKSQQATQQGGVHPTTPPTVNSPWTIPFASGAAEGHGAAWADSWSLNSFGTAVAVLIGNGSQQVTFSGDESAGVPDNGVTTGAVFEMGTGGLGGGYWSDPFLSIPRPRVDNRPAVLRPGYKPNYKLPPRRPRR